MLDLIDYKEKVFGKKVLENSFGSGVFLEKIVIRYIEASIREGYSRTDILVDNRDLNEDFLDNPSQTFNYVMCLNFKELFSKNLLPHEECFLNLDERNEKARNVYFLENYLNTELPLEGYTDEHFHVQYFDSKDNVGVQIADFSNILYSCLMDDKIDYTLELMKEKGILKNIFRFPQ